MMQPENLRFQHILQSIDNIMQFVTEDPDINSLRTIQAIHYELVIIGEATRHIPESFHQQFSDIPWKKMIALRNLLAHEYWKVKHDRILAAVHNLPIIRTRLEDIIQQSGF